MWSKRYKPVPGWRAKRTICDKIGEKPIISYCVIECPHYIADRKERAYYPITISNIAKLCGVAERTLYRWELRYVNKVLKQKGYDFSVIRINESAHGKYYTTKEIPNGALR